MPRDNTEVSDPTLFMSRSANHDRREQNSAQSQVANESSASLDSRHRSVTSGNRQPLVFPGVHASPPLPSTLPSQASPLVTASIIFTQFKVLTNTHSYAQVGRELLALDTTAPAGTTSLSMYHKAQRLYATVLKQSRPGLNREALLRTKQWTWTGTSEVPPFCSFDAMHTHTHILAVLSLINATHTHTHTHTHTRNDIAT
jgi:hypothetical protein